MAKSQRGRWVRRAVSTALSLALVSLVFVPPASAGSGSGQLDHLAGTVVGSAAVAVPDAACPTRFEPTGGSRQDFSGSVVVRNGRAESLSVSVCVICCFPGGRSLTGSFVLRTPGGTLTGDATGNLCTCELDLRFFMTLTVADGTHGLKKTRGDYMFQGSLEGGFSTVDGPFTSNTTLTAIS
jgi:hypothetical protein